MSDKVGPIQDRSWDTDISIRTSGNGLWSKVEKLVIVTKIEFDSEFEGITAHFDAKTWDVAKDGLIYTDPGFLGGLMSYLFTYCPAEGIDWSRLQYTEQGMQGVDWVSLELI